MKTLKTYLAENKKVYSFKIKVAKDVPENFEEDIKKGLAKVNVLTFEKLKTTPIQSTPPDFPTISNAEVTIYNVVLEYPITAPEIVNIVTDVTNVDEDHLQVRGSSEPSEWQEQMTTDHEDKAILDDPDYKEDNTEIDQKDLAGEEFNKSFLADLATAAKEREKSLGNTEKNPDVLGTHDKEKADKAGAKSTIGSK